MRSDLFLCVGHASCALAFFVDSVGFLWNDWSLKIPLATLLGKDIAKSAVRRLQKIQKITVSYEGSHSIERNNWILIRFEEFWYILKTEAMGISGKERSSCFPTSWIFNCAVVPLTHGHPQWMPETLGGTTLHTCPVSLRIHACDLSVRHSANHEWWNGTITAAHCNWSHVKAVRTRWLRWAACTWARTSDIGPAKWLAGGIRTEVTPVPGGTEHGSRVLHATRNGVQLKTCGLFLSGIFHLIFSGHSWPWLTETVESKTKDGGMTGPLLLYHDYSQLSSLELGNISVNKCGRNVRRSAFVILRVFRAIINELGYWLRKGQTTVPNAS